MRNDKYGQTNKKELRRIFLDIFSKLYGMSEEQPQERCLEVTLTECMGCIHLTVKVSRVYSKTETIETSGLDESSYIDRITAYEGFRDVLDGKKVSDLNKVHGCQDVLNFLNSISKEDDLSAGGYKKDKPFNKKPFNKEESCCGFWGS